MATEQTIKGHKCLGSAEYVLHACHGSNGLLSISKLQQLVVLELRDASVADLSPMSQSLDACGAWLARTASKRIGLRTD